MASNPIPDLWPDSVRAGNAHSPLTILKVQAENLNARMNGLLRGEIAQERSADKIDYAFVLHAPTLGRRTVLLHAIREANAPYPVDLLVGADRLLTRRLRRAAAMASAAAMGPLSGVSGIAVGELTGRGYKPVEDDEPIRCADAVAVQEALAQIFASDATRSVIASLLAAIQEGEAESAAETDSAAEA